ncbi:patatin-like phospholipase family protein [Solirubrobacter phytolaccae]|uniref:Patatin-like phospholipase family protein n=1 Tax=Solirubrobacter phytolaccae TaxID=1404360 RepID=A0A9X3S7B3_9ACTN|nr:patatin-like phospholipase family protein [Solirubrobacter phytolaccae]MDA0180859.1 patatin-like phospholipase family protein [Solirubrobacter phytolaccae]
MTRALAIDGGGIRGLIPALVLAEVERRTGRGIASLFDLIAGTSTGGIIACALTKPQPMSAEEVADIYVKDGPKIFNRTLLKTIKSVGGLLDEVYDKRGTDEVMARHFGAVKLGEASTRVLVTVYDVEAREPLVLRSTTDPDVTMAEASYATSAAPMYFEPIRVGERTLIDGGMFATNPAMYAYIESSPRPELLLALGTGRQTRPLPFADVKDWGKWEWGKPLVDIVSDGSAGAADTYLAALAGDTYVRIQNRLQHASDNLDDASAGNLANLRRDAERMIAEHDAVLDRVCAQLVS